MSHKLLSCVTVEGFLIVRFGQWFSSSFDHRLYNSQMGDPEHYALLYEMLNCQEFVGFFLEPDMKCEF